MKKIYTLCIIFCILSLTACSNDSDKSKIIIIASEKKSCFNENISTCYLVKEPNDRDWIYHYGEIQGFSYTEGYEYTISITIEYIENPPMDGFSYQYILKEIIKKEKKKSENIPE